MYVTAKYVKCSVCLAFSTSSTETLKFDIKCVFLPILVVFDGGDPDVSKRRFGSFGALHVFHAVLVGAVVSTPLVLSPHIRHETLVYKSGATTRRTQPGPSRVTRGNLAARVAVVPGPGFRDVVPAAGADADSAAAQVDLHDLELPVVQQQDRNRGGGGGGTSSAVRRRRRRSPRPRRPRPGPRPR